MFLCCDRPLQYHVIVLRKMIGLFQSFEQSITSSLTKIYAGPQRVSQVGYSINGAKREKIFAATELVANGVGLLR